MTRFVGCGDQVRQGQQIGEMGMSGNATGFHLHFEVREDDAHQNPLSYITVQDERKDPSNAQGR
jgi:murein DD-endopeptidase MepM/ murein hydrolase activator NlpD